MKGITLKLTIIIIMIILQSNLTFAFIDWERLGKQLTTEQDILGFSVGSGLDVMITTYFEHGSIIKSYHNGTVTTIVGYDRDDTGYSGFSYKLLKIKFNVFKF